MEELSSVSPDEASKVTKQLEDQSSVRLDEDMDESRQLRREEAEEIEHYEAARRAYKNRYARSGSVGRFITRH